MSERLSRVRFCACATEGSPFIRSHARYALGRWLFNLFRLTRPHSVVLGAHKHNSTLTSQPSIIKSVLVTRVWPMPVQRKLARACAYTHIIRSTSNTHGWTHRTLVKKVLNSHPPSTLARTHSRSLVLNTICVRLNTSIVSHTRLMCIYIFFYSLCGMLSCV